MSSDTGSGRPAQRVKQLAEAIYPYHRKYERMRDPRAVFSFVYFNITIDLAEKLDAPQSGFEDPEWVAGLAEEFGNRFLEAMNALDRWLATPEPRPPIHRAAPKPWADVYLAIRGGQSYVLEDLTFSMMAHISYDLPFALIEMKLDVARLSDYHLMNDVLAAKINFIQKSVAKRYQRFLMILDRLAGSYDEFLTNYGIRAARSVAWYNAMRLLSASARSQAVASIERSSGLLIDSVRNPKIWWLRLAVRVFRFLIPRRRRWPAQEEQSSRW